MPPRASNPNFRNGLPELLVLRLLQTAGEMYGYEIVQAIQGRAAGTLAVGEGVIYPVLHALEADDALKSRRKTVKGRSRIYYSLTAAGTRRLADLTGDWLRLGEIIRTILDGGQHGEALV
jgi:PadR family transcriptional regulator PadR